MEIRRAVLSDCERINELLYQVQQLHHLGRPDLFKANAKKYTDSQLKEIIGDDMRPIFVCADCNGTVLGYVFCIKQCNGETENLNALKTLYIDDLCVDEQYRGRHIGTLLCEYAVNYAKENGFDNITLNVWANNESALKFYEKFGFAVQKRCMEIVL